MKHIFLTGEIQVGKSTAIRKALDAMPFLTKDEIGGFLTVAGNRTVKTSGYVHIIAADGTEQCTKENAVFYRKFTNGSRHFDVYTEVFDGHGVELLQNTAGKRLILMDEVGTAEKDCEQFHRQILETLSGDIPVLGVVQIRQGGFLDEIRNHPNVRVITVTKENRNSIPEQIIKAIG